MGLACLIRGWGGHRRRQNFTNGNPKIFSTRPDQVEANLHRICLQERNVQKIDLLVALLPDKNGALYGYIHIACLM